ncbi:hypothetical protein [Nocardia cyriacigeorgica]|nr:hypothetical protein [Nocardia cyriacigeorgica]
MPRRTEFAQLLHNARPACFRIPAGMVSAHQMRDAGVIGTPHK